MTHYRLKIGVVKLMCVFFGQLSVNVSLLSANALSTQVSKLNRNTVSVIQTPQLSRILLIFRRTLNINIRLWSRENKLANVAAYYSVLQARTTNYDLVKLTALYEVTVTEQNRQKLVTEHH